MQLFSHALWIMNFFITLSSNRFNISIRLFVKLQRCKRNCKQNYDLIKSLEARLFNCSGCEVNNKHLVIFSPAQIAQPKRLCMLEKLFMEVFLWHFLCACLSLQVDFFVLLASHLCIHHDLVRKSFNECSTSLKLLLLFYYKIGVLYATKKVFKCSTRTRKLDWICIF